jgi:hypothetical protein
MDQEPTMTTDPALTSRRRLIVGGGIGAAAAAFLAACGSKSGAPAGQSGVSPTTTNVAPTVPTTLPNKTALEYNTTVLRTGASLELVVANAYQMVSATVRDAALKETVGKLQEIHTANAKVFNDGIESAGDRITEANAFVQQNVIDPVKDDLDTDEQILDFLDQLESSLAATYVTGAGAYQNSAKWRAQLSTFAAESARRAALFAHGGQGQDPTGALYDLADLVSNDAYMVPDSATTTSAAE